MDKTIKGIIIAAFLIIIVGAVGLTSEVSTNKDNVVSEESDDYDSEESVDDDDEDYDYDYDEDEYDDSSSYSSLLYEGVEKKWKMYINITK